MAPLSVPPLVRAKIFWGIPIELVRHLRWGDFVFGGAFATVLGRDEVGQSTILMQSLNM